MKLKALGLAALLGIASYAEANPLDEIWYSKEMSAVHQATMIDWLAGVPKGSNFEAAMRDPLKMLAWIWKNDPAFRPGEKKWNLFSAGVYAKQKFETGTKAVFKENNTLKTYLLTIMAPVPKFHMNFEANLIPEISVLRPPELKVESIEPVDINGIPAKLFYKKNGACSLFLTITKNVVVNIDGESCSDVRQLIDFGRVLDIKRLQEKLDT